MTRFALAPASLGRRLPRLAGGAALMVASTLVAPQAQALGTSALLDVVIQAIEPQLQPAKPFVLCLIDGGSAQDCLDKEIAKQTAALGQQATDQAKAALPFDPNDSRIAQIIAVVKAASQGKWLEVLSKGGTTVGKIVVCAALPPGVKSVGCPVTDYVIDNNKQLLDDAWDAVSGPDWWKLATLLGPQTACQFIPIAEIKATLCGPLGEAIGAAVALAEGGAKALADALGDASELLVDFTEDVSGQDPPMAPEKYYQTFWGPQNHWYVLMALRGGSTTVPDMGLEYSPCVGYFDSHKASKATAQKWCGKLRQQAQAQFKTSLAAAKAAPATYMKSTLEPQLPRLVLEHFHATTSPMAGDLYTDCVYTVRDRVPIYGVLPQQNPMKSKLGSPPFTAWEWACKEVRTLFDPAFAAYKAQGVPALSAKLINAGCKVWTPTSKGDEKLRYFCDSWQGYAACKAEVAALGASETHCGLDGTQAGAKLAAQIAAELGAKRCTVPATSLRTVQCTRPWKVTKCQARVDQVQGGSVDWATAVSCVAREDPAFVAGKAQVQSLLFKLNGGVGSKSSGGTTAGEAGAWKPATGTDCKSTWDPLAIVCNSLQVLATHGVNLPECPADPNQDGADVPCLAPMLFDAVQEGAMKVGPAFDGPLTGVAGSTPAAPGPAVRAPMNAPLEPVPGAFSAPPAARGTGMPGIAAPEAAPVERGRLAPLTGTRGVAIQGCEPVSGRIGELACTTPEAHARCERARLAGTAGIRVCQNTAARPGPPAPAGTVHRAPMPGPTVVAPPPAADTATMRGPMTPATVPGGRLAPSVAIPGCEPLAGQPGAFQCVTRDALTACERQRIANPAAVSHCQAMPGRTRP